MLSSANPSNRYNEGKESLDARSLAYKRRKSSVMHKPDAAMKLIENALNTGITAEYLLIDSWFTNEPLIKKVLKTGLDVIGMVKPLKQTYQFENRRYTLNELRKQVKFPNTSKEIYGSIQVRTIEGIAVKMVFIRNRNKRSEFLALLCTNLELSESMATDGKLKCSSKRSKAYSNWKKSFRSVPMMQSVPMQPLFLPDTFSLNGSGEIEMIIRLMVIYFGCIVMTSVIWTLSLR